MRLLLDSQVFLAVIHQRLDELPRGLREAARDTTSDHYVSAASLWEIAIKVRLGKLSLAVDLGELPQLVADTGFIMLDIDARHALAEAKPVPATRDPFDRMLLAQCAVEGLLLLTTDRVLAAHPLAWRP